MPLQGVPIALLGLVAVGIVLILISFRFIRARSTRQLLSAGLVFLLVCAFAIAADVLPAMVNVEQEHAFAVLLRQIASVF